MNTYPKNLEQLIELREAIENQRRYLSSPAQYHHLCDTILKKLNFRKRENNWFVAIKEDGRVTYYFKRKTSKEALRDYEHLKKRNKEGDPTYPVSIFHTQVYERWKSVDRQRVVVSSEFINDYALKENRVMENHIESNAKLGLSEVEMTDEEFLEKLGKERLTGDPFYNIFKQSRVIALPAKRYILHPISLLKVLEWHSRI